MAEQDVDDLSLAFGQATGAPVEARGELDALINAYADARLYREQADDHAKKLRATETEIEGKLFEAMERLNLRAVRHARGLFTLNDLAWAVVDDEGSARDWAESNMPELLLLNRQRLSVVVREHLKGERDALPPGVSWRTSRGINWRRG